MKRIIFICIAIVGLLSALSCVGEKTDKDAYQLTHSIEDAEYILGWDSIISQCPDLGNFDKLGDFIHRGESKQLSTGETFAIEMDSPVAWSSVRFVRTEWTGETFRSFGIYIMYCDTNEGLDEYLQMADISSMLQVADTQEDDEFITAVVETETPMQSIQLILAGKHFFVMLGEYASPDESLFFSKDKLTELISTAKDNVDFLETTPLPSDIPERIGWEKPYQHQRL